MNVWHKTFRNGDTTASWIRAKRLGWRSTAKKSTNYTRSTTYVPGIGEQNMIRYVRTLHNRLYRSWTNWAETLPHPPFLADLSPSDYHFSSASTTFWVRSAFKRMSKTSSLISSPSDFYTTGFNISLFLVTKMCWFERFLFRSINLTYQYLITTVAL